MTDSEIIDLYLDGQQEAAFNQIVETYTERLYWHIRRFLCSHEDTHDLQLYTWLYRIATNEVLNHLRRQKVRAMISLDSASGILSRKIDEDPYFNGDKLQRELHKAMLKLPEKQRIVFSLRYFDEMKYEDIALITGTSVGALKASYHHAYNKIKREIETLL